MLEDDDTYIDDQKFDQDFPENKPIFRTIIRFIITFIKKHRKALSIITAIGLILTIIYSLIPVVSVGNTRLVNTGASVKLEKNQIAKLKMGNVSVEIINFSNDSCPKGKTCFGSSKSVEYEMIINGQKYATGSANSDIKADYEIETVSSDYKTYADIKIIKSN